MPLHEDVAIVEICYSVVFSIYFARALPSEWLPPGKSLFFFLLLLLKTHCESNQGSITSKGPAFTQKSKGLIDQTLVGTSEIWQAKLPGLGSDGIRHVVILVKTATADKSSPVWKGSKVTN